MNGRRVLLAGGAPPAALAVARSLVRAGWTVEATESRFGDRAPRSRRVVPVPAAPAAEDPAGFAAAVLAAAARGGRPVVVPCTEAALRALEARRAEIEAIAEYPLPPADVLRRALDKRETLAAARQVGLAVPNTFTVLSAADSARCPLRAPFVLKPIFSRWRDASGQVRRTCAHYARDAEDLRTAVAALLARGAPGVLVQEFVPGTGWGVGLIVRGGEPAAVFVHRRVRELHPAGGPSTAAVAEPPDPAVVAPAVALLRALGWEGLAMVEFRREAAGAPVLMEVNGRPWGTLGLGVDSGVDFPRLWLEGHRGPPPAYRAGTRRRWIAGDLRRVGAAWAGAPPGYPGRFPSARRALTDALFSASRDLVFRWSDPVPFLAEAAEGILTSLRGGRTVGAAATPLPRQARP